MPTPVYELNLAIPPELDPFRQALETTLVAWGLNPKSAADHIGRMVEGLAGPSTKLAQLLTEGLSNDTKTTTQRLELRALFDDLIMAASRVGPVELTIDRLTDAPGIWFFLERLLATPHPICVVVKTHPNYPLTPSTWPTDHTQVKHLHPGLLSDSEAQTLLDNLLPLAPAFRILWASKLKQDPQFGVAGLLYAVQRDLVCEGPDGWEPRADADVPVDFSAWIA